MAGVGTEGKDELVALDKMLSGLIITIRDEYEKEDRLEREERKPLWTKLERYFNGMQRLFWDKVATDWRVIDQEENQTRRHYDKVENIYRAHAESIIAALSVRPPSAIFYPSDADVEEDVTTAKICVKLKQKIEKENAAKLGLIKSLMILFNQGTIAAYIYNHKHSKYGTYTSPTYAKEGVMTYTTLLNCPECGSNIDEVVSQKERAKIPEEVRKCEVCGFNGVPLQEDYEEMLPQIVGTTVNPKTKTCIDIYSPLFVHIPFYARKQENVPYVCLKFEQHYAALKNLYPKLRRRGVAKGVDTLDAEDRGIVIGVNASNLCTVECWWFRDWALDTIDGRDAEIKKLKDKYPDGMYVVIIDDQVVEINNENLDDHWHISENPLATYIHGEPLGKPLAPIQDMKNEVNDLEIETFEHAIPETHARADVLDFKKYAKQRAAPGMVFPANPPADGQPLANAFHTLKTATLSEEYELFNQKLDNAAQFVTGSFPSIYGGPATSGSKTAREYTESRAMALQRLGLSWDILKFFWAGVMSRAVPLQIHCLREYGQDEKMVEKVNTGFVNTWIRQTDLDGRIGSIEADAEEGLPLNAAQLKDTLMNLLTLKDDVISSALYHPNNTPLLTKALGAPDFYIPNSDDRDKQYAEFTELLSGIPVEVNPSVDNHGIEAEVCRSFLVSPTGRAIKRNNFPGWQAIEQHMVDHLEAAKLMAASGMPSAGPESVNSEEEVSSEGE